MICRCPCWLIAHVCVEKTRKGSTAHARHAKKIMVAFSNMVQTCTRIQLLLYSAFNICCFGASEGNLCSCFLGGGGGGGMGDGGWDICFLKEVLQALRLQSARQNRPPDLVEP